MVQHFEFLSPARVADLYARHRELPDSLVPDQRALLAAVLCLGRLSELCFEPTKEGGSRMRPIAPREAREDVTYFRMALSHLDAFGAASCTALCEFVAATSRIMLTLSPLYLAPLNTFLHASGIIVLVPPYPCAHAC